MTSLRTARRFVFPLLALWVLLYASFSLFKPPLLDGPDALSAEIAREMLTRGHWLVPFANGIRYLNHPPLLYWSIAASFQLFGISDWAARLPIALATLGIFIAVFSLGRRIFHAPAAGFYSALALLTSYGIFLFGHLLLRDVFLCLWTTLAINLFWRSLAQDRHRLLTSLGFALCCAFGVLSQGLAGVVFPLSIVLIYLLATGNLRHLLRWHPWLSVLLFLAVVLPFHIAVHVLYGPARIGAFLMPSVQGRVPLLIFWLLLLLWILPWCAFSIRGMRIGSSPAASIRRDARLLCLIWILVVLVCFSFTARQEFNLLTALPPMAILAGGWLAEDESMPHHQGRIAAWILFFLGFAAAAVVAWLLMVAAPIPSGLDIATLLRPRPIHHAVFFGYFLDLTRPAMGAFRGALWITLTALLAGVTGGLIFRLRDNARVANCFLAGMAVAILIAAHLALNTFSPVLSSRILAEAIKPEIRSRDAVVINGSIEDASSFVFYLNREVLLLHNPAPHRLTRVSNPAFFIDGADLARLWNGSPRVWLWSQADTLPHLPGQTYLIGRSGGKVIVSNQPDTGGASF